MIMVVSISHYLHGSFKGALSVIFQCFCVSVHLPLKTSYKNIGAQEENMLCCSCPAFAYNNTYNLYIFYPTFFTYSFFLP
ncbi:hypothetical protein C0J52_04465 [Blattella germanica]|nr:hypothetical protein C0J52_04465 [Blattella germanica]